MKLPQSLKRSNIQNGNGEGPVVSDSSSFAANDALSPASTSQVKLNQRYSALDQIHDKQEEQKSGAWSLKQISSPVENHSQPISIAEIPHQGARDSLAGKADQTRLTPPITTKKGQRAELLINEQETNKDGKSSIPISQDQEQSFESQMDDFAIKDEDNSRRSRKKDDADGEPSRKRNGDGDSSDESQAFEEDDPETQVQSYLENYYEKNYDCYEVNEVEDAVHQKVWSLQFDETHDIIYVFLATIKNVAGEKERVDKKLAEAVMNSKNFKYHKEYSGLQRYKHAQVSFELTLQLWSMDDRIIRDRDHRRRPMFQFSTLKLKKDMENSEPMNTFQMMMYLRNMYQSYAQVVMSQSQIYFFQDKSNIIGYDVEKKMINSKRIQVFDDELQPYNFRLIPHFKDVGRSNQSMESLFVLNYSQKINEEENGQHQGLNIHRQISTNSELESPGLHLLKQTVSQKMTLTIIEMENIKQSSLFEKLRSRKAKQAQNQSLENRTQQIKLKDDLLLFYYENDRDIKLIRNLFVQRVAESMTYLVLFPTGLLLTLGANPLTLHSRLQLNLKKDERIIDCCYCISLCGKNQCIWVLDQKLQVWKCTSEHNPNQTNWSLQKVTGFTNNSQKSFFQSATNFDAYYLVNDLQKIKSLPILKMENGLHMEYLFDFNKTATKAVVVQQPDFKMLKKNLDVPFDGSLTDYCTTRLCIQELLLDKCSKIRIYVIAKYQPMIMNNIFLKKSQCRFACKDDQAILDKTQQHIREQMRMATENAGDNEIMELIYMGKASFIMDPTTHKLVKLKKNESDLSFSLAVKEYRQFMVRRRKHLEIIYTNGIVYWQEKVPKSEVKHPYYIQDIMMDKNNKTLIAYYTIPANESAFYAHIFNYDLQLDSFVRKESNHEDGGHHKQSPKNLSINAKGEIIEIKASLFQSKLSLENLKKNITLTFAHGNLSISLPKNLFFKELLQEHNELDRFLQSGDGRILMCDRVIIHLNKNLSRVSDVGCILYERDHSIIKYSFLSLLKEQERDRILKLVKKPITLKHIVKFDFDCVPIFSADSADIMYFINYLDIIENASTNGTSIIKISTHSLNCVEIYQSKYKIIHFTMNENNTVQENMPSLSIQQNSEKRSGLQEFVNANQSIQTSKIADSCLEFDEGTRLTKGVAKEKAGVRKDDKIQIKMNDFMPKAAHSQKAPDEELDLRTNLLSLISQNKNQINVEILLDNNFGINYELHRSDDRRDHQGFEQRKKLQMMKSKLLCYVSVQSTNEFVVTSEVGWISENKLILTINNEYHLMNLNHNDLYKTRNNIYWGKQQIHTGLFVTIVSAVGSMGSIKPRQVSHSESNLLQQIKPQALMSSTEKKMEEPAYQQKKNEKIIKAQDCIYKMEIASLSRYAFIRQANYQSGLNKMILFFTPCEELNGASIFTKLSANYNIVQPYVEQIDAQFIEFLNLKIRNVNYFLKNRYKADTNKGSEFRMSSKQQSYGSIERKGEDKASQMAGNSVHMFQDDISGTGAIDHAFSKNSIFCIKSFMDSLLNLTHAQDSQFGNCFDQAVLLMIQKGMDVKELINSKLLYPQIWESYTYFSEIQTPVIVAYNNELEDLEYEDPQKIFDDQKDISYTQTNDKNMLTKKHKSLIKRREQYQMEGGITPDKAAGGNASTFEDQMLEDIDEHEGANTKTTREQYEMQFNYIDLETIQGDEKITLTKALMESDDLLLFEQEVIQNIIDYKWQTYAKQFFVRKFLLFNVFLIFFVWDLETLNIYDQHGDRIKDWQFWIRKVAGFTIQLYFLIYEFIQISKLKKQYFRDLWNYFEVLGVIFYWCASYLDFVNQKMSDWCRIIYVVSLALSLVKVLYLIRVFKSLSFLVKMLIQVIVDLNAFTVLFLAFVIVTAISFNVVNTDMSGYGRIPNIFAEIISTFRLAFGEFTVIDPYTTFDYKDSDGEYSREYKTVVTSFLIFVFSSVFLYLMLMNFIIAVICESYAKVKKYAVAHDYKQRVDLIYELEVLFKESDFINQTNFPNILIVRKRKIRGQEKVETNLGMLKYIKQNLKEHQVTAKEYFSERIDESKQQLSNQIHILENEMWSSSKDIQKLFEQVQKFDQMSSMRLVDSPCVPENHMHARSTNSSLTVALPINKGEVSIHSISQFKNKDTAELSIDELEEDRRIVNVTKAQLPVEKTQNLRFSTAPVLAGEAGAADQEVNMNKDKECMNCGNFASYMKIMTDNFSEFKSTNDQKIQRISNQMSKLCEIQTQMQQRQEILINAIAQQQSYSSLPTSPQFFKDKSISGSNVYVGSDDVGDERDMLNQGQSYEDQNQNRGNQKHLRKHLQTQFAKATKNRNSPFISNVSPKKCQIVRAKTRMRSRSPKVTDTQAPLLRNFSKSSYPQVAGIDSTMWKRRKQKAAVMDSRTSLQGSDHSQY